eukprot:11481286-Alexandrium_andersonii.AAC.1
MLAGYVAADRLSLRGMGAQDRQARLATLSRTAPAHCVVRQVGEVLGLHPLRVQGVEGLPAHAL